MRLTLWCILITLGLIWRELIPGDNLWEALGVTVMVAGSAISLIRDYDKKEV